MEIFGEFVDLIFAQWLLVDSGPGFSIHGPLILFICQSMQRYRSSRGKWGCIKSHGGDVWRDVDEIQQFKKFQSSLGARKVSLYTDLKA